MNATLKIPELIFLSDTQCDSTILLRKKLQNYILSSSRYKDLPASIKDISFLNYGKSYLMNVVLKIYNLYIIILKLLLSSYYKVKWDCDCMKDGNPKLC
jgi:hypothetical protein